MKRALLFLLCLVGCHHPSAPSAPADWITQNVGKFKFQTPQELSKQEVQGIDSFVGQYLSSDMSVSFDYGRYSDPLTSPEYTSVSDGWIHGRAVHLASSSNINGFAFHRAAHFAVFDSSGAGLTMSVFYAREDQGQTATQILESIE